MKPRCPDCGSTDLGFALAAVRNRGPLFVSVQVAETPNGENGPLTAALTLRSESGRFLTDDDASAVRLHCFDCAAATDAALRGAA